jgi:two-component system, OmpR family, sensor histidine kinase CiaH
VRCVFHTIMKREIKEKRTLRILYVLAGYIALQLTWWGYLLVQLNTQNHDLRSTMLNDASQSDLRNKVLMVIGEGTVFFILLALGFRYIKRTVSRQLELARMEQTFLLSVTHELKTPIAAVKLNLETMKSRSLTSDQSAQMVDLALAETKRLQSLTDNILLATRLDQRTGSLLLQHINVSALVSEELRRYKSIYGAQIDAEIQAGVFLEGDEQMLAALVINLIDNAVKYSQEKVAVKLFSTENAVVFEVTDHGPGIPVEDSQQIFEKFYRGGHELSRKTKGTGLGLYIVRNVARLHQGDVSVSPNHPKGSIFAARIPLKQIK